MRVQPTLREMAEDCQRGALRLAQAFGEVAASSGLSNLEMMEQAATELERMAAVVRRMAQGERS